MRGFPKLAVWEFGGSLHEDYSDVFRGLYWVLVFFGGGGNHHYILVEDDSTAELPPQS